MAKKRESHLENAELIVLVRSKPDEAVLAACKFNNTAGPSTTNKGCAAVSITKPKKCDGFACSTGINS